MHDNTLNFNAINNLVKYAKEYGHRKIKNAGFSDTEHHICVFLYFHDGVSQDTVAETLMINKTTVAKALTCLVNKGFLLRAENKDNRRKNSLHLTAAGRASVTDFVSIYDEWTGEVTACLTEEEKKMYFEICTRLCKRAKQINEDLK